VIEVREMGLNDVTCSGPGMFYFLFILFYYKRAAKTCELVDLARLMVEHCIVIDELHFKCK
jgi:hypothetical protein